MENYLKAWREFRGLTGDELAAAIGTDKTQISKLENSKRRLTTLWLERLARALRAAPDALLRPPPPDALAEEAPAYVDLRAARPLPELDSRERGLPIYASAEGGRTGMMYTTEPIDWMPIPGPLQNVRGAFGVYVVGDSMEPRFEQGDLVFVDPTKPTRVGNDLLLGKPEDGTTTAMVKRLAGRDATRWRLKQYNPPREFWVKRADWPQVMVIVGKYSRG